jgi:single-stranded-DNA-specific exonuclease
MREPAGGRLWRLRDFDAGEAAKIAAVAGVEPVVGRVLSARGVTAESASDYLNPSLRKSLPDPFVLKDMERATERLHAAATNGEMVGVFGDYDVDGTTAAALLKQYFSAIGAPLCVYLPDRIMEGYGPSIEAFRDLARQGAKVIVTVDCGAAAHEVIEQAAGEGLEVIVFDHHQMAGPPPKGALATVNPNRLDDTSGLSNLSAAGVAFMGIVAINRALRRAGFFAGKTEPDLKRFLDLAALGLVCDVMPMTGLTRVLVAQGLKVLGEKGNPGLAALAARCGINGDHSTYHLGFLLGPRINAAGRIGHARLALELLTTDDAARRADLAEKLHVMNAERQAIEAAVLADALRVAEGTRDDIVVVAGEGWHPGVIGIVAGRLKEQLDRPAIVIALDGETAKGSGRSIAGVDLGAAILAAKRDGILISGGGHAMAAGLTVERSRVGELSAFLNDRLAREIIVARNERRLDVDGVIAATSVTKAFADVVERAGPYGPGNPEPVFVLTDVRADFAKTVGSDHLSCLLLSETGERVRAIAFRGASNGLGDLLRSSERIHVAGKIRADDWRGGEAAQFQIVDAARAI